ncbi:uncharacterized protein PHALS_03688 [Plasmopara halstedii]|uniref:Uncharacterized protein n=1 Tax=Plasmopara halstedii TaxID=4781 RepID=A0A0P1B0K1_PLAHL|nr:uncharacterized protein PHALS_03688 [Plasmopara halstedii]CEG47024.1 hypothetical protein PHALS_03688 [Plasmopara halstedii]|eukprot:XP_024583393.1 hypothetical protein PHALS_03688 [Plasmopara halstedii]
MNREKKSNSFNDTPQAENRIEYTTHISSSSRSRATLMVSSKKASLLLLQVHSAENASSKKNSATSEGLWVFSNLFFIPFEISTSSSSSSFRTAGRAHRPDQRKAIVEHEFGSFWNEQDLSQKLNCFFAST